MRHPSATCFTCHPPMRITKPHLSSKVGWVSKLCRRSCLISTLQDWQMRVGHQMVRSNSGNLSHHQMLELLKLYVLHVLTEFLRRKQRASHLATGQRLQGGRCESFSFPRQTIYGEHQIRIRRAHDHERIFQGRHITGCRMENARSAG